MTIIFNGIKLASSALMYFNSNPGDVDQATGDELTNLTLVFLTNREKDAFLIDVLACDNSNIKYVSDEGDDGLTIAINPSKIRYGITN